MVMDGVIFDLISGTGWLSISGDIALSRVSLKSSRVTIDASVLFSFSLNSITVLPKNIIQLNLYQILCYTETVSSNQIIIIIIITM